MYFCAQCHFDRYRFPVVGYGLPFLTSLRAYSRRRTAASQFLSRGSHFFRPMIKSTATTSQRLMVPGFADRQNIVLP